MRWFLGIVMGFVSGLIIYFILALLFTSHGRVAEWVVVVGLLGGWFGSAALFIVNTTTPGRVASRAFLFGAGEWVVMIFAGLVSSARAYSEVTAGAHGEYSEATRTGATLGTGLSFVFIAVISVVLAIGCLVGYLVTKNLGAEMKAERMQTKRCPDCAETIQLDARKCRFCGADQVSQTQAAVE